MSQSRQPAFPHSIDWRKAPKGLVVAIIAGQNYAPIELVSRQMPTMITASVPTRKIGEEGPAICGSAGWRYEYQTGFDRMAGNGTIFAVGRNPTNASTGLLISSSEGSNGYGVAKYYDDAAIATNSFYLWGNNGNIADSAFDVLGANAELYYHRTAISWDGTNVRFWVKGLLVRTVASAFAPTAHAGRKTRLFTNYGESLTANHDLVAVYVFDRALSAPEMRALAENPYSFIRTKRARARVAGGAAAYTLTADGGSYAIAGTAATLKRGLRVTADAGSYALAGTAATLKAARQLSAAGATYAVTGTAATLTRGLLVTADAGSFTIAGTAAAVRKTSVLAAAAGAFNVSGTAAGLVRAARLTAAPGSYSIAGSDATLVYGAVGSYTLVANGGAYALSGTAAGLTAARRIDAASSSYTITGTAAGLAPSRRLTAAAGAFLITGTAAGLTPSAAGLAQIALSEGLVSQVALSEALASRVAITESLIG